MGVARRRLSLGVTEDSSSFPSGPACPPGCIGQLHLGILAKRAVRTDSTSVAARDLRLPHALTKRPVNHASANDIAEGCAADWTIGQLPNPAQGITDCIELAMSSLSPDSETP